MEDLGVAGMVRSALWLERAGGMEVLNIGRAANSLDDCTLELAGSQLLVRLSLSGTWIWLSAVGLDASEAPELICNLSAKARRAGLMSAGWS
jgi:hypothetical protein